MDPACIVNFVLRLIGNLLRLLLFLPSRLQHEWCRGRRRKHASVFAFNGEPCGGVRNQDRGLRGGRRFEQHHLGLVLSGRPYVWRKKCELD